MTFSECTAFDLSTQSAAIGELLRRGKSDRSERERSPSLDVQVIDSANFVDMAEARQAYESLEPPVVYIVQPAEVPLVLEYLRSEDELALASEPEALTQWRMDRVAKSIAKQVDPLTKTYLRTELMDSLKHACSRASRNHPTSLILLDIDHFKSLNDQFGAAACNRLLGELGSMIRTLCVNTMVARTRGGEFGILIDGSEAISKQVADILQESISNQDWQVVKKITASFGVASTNCPCEPSLLLTQADEALFSAKANGRDRVITYSEIVSASSRFDDDVDVINLENKARVLSERVTNFVTQRSKQIMETLRHEANTDGLTKLFNRRYMDKRLAEEFSQASKNQSDLSVAMIDLDHFGQVNKQYGWPTGDLVLQSAAKRIADNIRSSDWVGRYGGEEFCVVMPDTALEKAIVVCQRVREAVSGKLFQPTSALSLKVTLSVGVTSLKPDDLSVGDLIDRASDNALEAKNSGRNRLVSD